MCDTLGGYLTVCFTYAKEHQQLWVCENLVFNHFPGEALEKR